MEILYNSELQKLILEYRQVDNENAYLGFNVFALTSDVFYKENYHSDIISAFLNPIGLHNEGSLFLEQFIEMINSANDKYDDRWIDIRNYINAEVIREEGRIDILIRTESKHCIIIENKINNANDMPQQLPRYYEYMHEKGYDIDAIVYIPLNNEKNIDKTSWVNLPIKYIEKLVKVIPAFDTQSVCLVRNWIEPSMQKSSNIDCISLLRQYSKLIKSLTSYKMNDIHRNALLQKLIETPELFDQATTFVQMMSELPETMATNLSSRFNKNEVIRQYIKKIVKWPGQVNTCVIYFSETDKSKFDVIYIYTCLDKYKAYSVSLTCFSNNTHNACDINWLNRLTFDAKMDKSNNGDYERIFEFGKEDDVVRFVEQLIIAANQTCE